MTDASDSRPSASSGLPQFHEPGSPDATWRTFTMQLPFTVGLGFEQQHSHTIVLPENETRAEWVDEGGLERFGPHPLVVLKFARRRLDRIAVWPEGVSDVVKQIYDVELPITSDNAPGYDEDGSAYEQWVSIETQIGRLAWEPADDAAFTFHRALAGLNLFLASYVISFGKGQVRPVVTADLGRIVIVGARGAGDVWTFQGPLLMHPENVAEPLPDPDVPRNQAKLREGVEMVIEGHPGVAPKIWRWRSFHARRRGDEADRVISLQTSMESLLYATLRTILVDLNKTREEIGAIASPYKAFDNLIADTMPSLVGGSWDRTIEGSPVWTYWNDLYLLRNEVVHHAALPTPLQGEKADAGYVGMRNFINERVWAKRYQYPRTVAARFGNPQLAGLRPNRRMSDLLAEIHSEGRGWWLPWDEVGRAESRQPLILKASQANARRNNNAFGQSR